MFYLACYVPIQDHDSYAAHKSLSKSSRKTFPQNHLPTKSSWFSSYTRITLNPPWLKASFITHKTHTSFGGRKIKQTGSTTRHKQPRIRHRPSVPVVVFGRWEKATYRISKDFEAHLIYFVLLALKKSILHPIVRSCLTVPITPMEHVCKRSSVVWCKDVRGVETHDNHHAEFSDLDVVCYWSARVGTSSYPSGEVEQNVCPKKGM